MVIFSGSPWVRMALCKKASAASRSRVGVSRKSNVARSPAPHYLHTTQDQAHSRLISAITAPQTPRWRPPATGDYASQPLTGTRRAALLGTCARARATRRPDPLNTIATFSFSRRLTLHSHALYKVARRDACAWSGAKPPKERSHAHPPQPSSPMDRHSQDVVSQRSGRAHPPRLRADRSRTTTPTQRPKGGAAQ